MALRKSVWHRSLKAAALTLSLIGVCSVASGDVTLKNAADTGIPLVYFYHGMVLDENMQPIKPTTDNIARVLRRYSDGLAALSPDDVKVRYVEVLKNANDTIQMDTGTEALISIGLSRWLLGNNDYPSKESVQAELRALEAWASIPGRSSINAQFRADARLAPTIAALNLDVSEPAPAPPPDTTPYIEQCKLGQVPIPPDWNDPAWKLLYLLDPHYSFVADSDSIAQVWIYKSPDPNIPGLCIGLPRRDRETDDIGLFGIICQGKSPGKACFWDNVDRVTGKRLTPEESENLKITAVQDASMLGENCTNCHRGTNVFMMHPRTAVDLRGLFRTEPTDWYEPISGQSTWGNPGPIQGLQTCNTCHDLPEVADDNNTSSKKSYCRILRQVVDKTMPPNGMPAGWLHPQSHGDDVKFFRGKCDQ